MPCREVVVDGEEVLLFALGCKGAFAADALVVDVAAGAGDGGAFHRHAEVLAHKVDGREYRQVGVAFAAAGAAVEGHLLQGVGGEQVAEAPGVGGEGRVARDDRHEDARADGSATGAHVSAGTAGHLPAAAYHLRQAGGEVNLHAVGRDGVVVGRQQGGTHQHVVLGAVHVAEGLRHHLLQDGDGVLRRLGEAHGDDGIHALGVAVGADVVTLGAARLAGFPAVAQHALHHRVPVQILQRSAADKAFFVAVHRCVVLYGS